MTKCVYYSSIRNQDQYLNRKIKMSKKSELKPLNAVIQICPDCGMIDVYKNDGHECDADVQEQRRRSIWND